MRQSSLFTKTRKSAPADEVAKNAQLLVRAGFVHKEMAGVYDYLPLGLRVIEKIRSIIGEEMNAIGGKEVLLSALQDPEIWKATDRWSDEKVDVWFKTELKNAAQLGLGCTHEEPMVRMMRDHISSYRDLPRITYQFQTKFRNELRAKSGIIRGREFLMKDMYSFTKDEAALDAFYDEAIQAYKNVYQRVGIGEKTFLTFASGGMFSQYSHEFQTICDAGEDRIFIDDVLGIAVNEDVMQDEILESLGTSRDRLREAKSVEVGNIFKYGTRYTKELGLTYKDEEGNEQGVVLGAYGIGVGRLMGTIVELMADDKGLVWPESVAPFRVHLIVLGANEETRRVADGVYDTLRHAGIEVLYDDREASAGEKFADADLIGLPWRLVVSDKSLASGGVEIKARTKSESEIVPIDSVVERLNYV